MNGRSYEVVSRFEDMKERTFPRAHCRCLKSKLKLKEKARGWGVITLSPEPMKWLAFSGVIKGAIEHFPEFTVRAWRIQAQVEVEVDGGGSDLRSWGCQHGTWEERQESEELEKGDVSLLLQFLMILVIVLGHEGSKSKRAQERVYYRCSLKWSPSNIHLRVNTGLGTSPDVAI